MVNIPFLNNKNGTKKVSNLTIKYRKIGYLIISLFLVEIVIGYVNGGGKQIIYAAPKQVYYDSENGSQGAGAQVFSIEVLKNGATRTIFSFTKNNYDYLKKNIKVNIGKTTVQSKFINDRYFMVESPAKIPANSIKVKVTANNGTGTDRITSFTYSVNTKKVNESRFATVDKEKFDILYINKEISESNKKIEKLNHTLDNTNNQIELDNTQILSLKSTLDGTVVQTDKIEINNQIDNLQQSLQVLSGKISETNKKISDESNHLKQLREEKKKYE